jgi:bacterioferritin
MSEIDKKRVIDLLNRILESELAGVIRYTHYSFLVYGYTRIPIVSWLRDQATESLTHAQLAGEMITQLGAYPSLGIGRLLDSHQHDIGKVLVESMEHEAAALSLYKELLSAVEGASVMLEEYARQMIYAEELHAGEVDKMLRKPGEVSATGLGPKSLWRLDCKELAPARGVSPLTANRPDGHNVRTAAARMLGRRAARDRNPALFRSARGPSPM